MSLDWAPPAATLLVGILGVGGTFLAGERLRRHGQLMAREQREQERRATAYVDALVCAERMKGYFENVEPPVDVGFPVPDGPSAEEQARTKALITAYGSHEVRELFECWYNIVVMAGRTSFEIKRRASDDDGSHEVEELRSRFHHEIKPENSARIALAQRINLELCGEI
ncbi:hypothetical protein O7607_09520 [Micromonospora sp. WMMA1949]|uniref:hypothetical protein n=1 Tax=unclassified Micromonospora TaxID=2617518 RepID=UPI0022B72454|nr:hypothetical protein [Micromonospora sp. WMMA1949]MCZ7425970.1 hypothetical protein [Micromonospora sp. WMMA1949]